MNIIPRIRVTPAQRAEFVPNEGTPANFSVDWLIFSIWTTDKFELELSAVFGTMYGVGLRGAIPYLRWSACVPFSLKFRNWFLSKTRRTI